MEHTIPAPSVAKMTEELNQFWGDSVEQVVLKKTGLNNRLLGENKVHGQLVGLALRVTVLQTNGCLRFLKKWPAKFVWQKVVGCRKVVRDVDTEETLVELTADHHDLMTTVLSVEGNETLDGEEEDEEDEEEEDDDDGDLSKYDLWGDPEEDKKKEEVKPTNGSTLKPINEKKASVLLEEKKKSRSRSRSKRRSRSRSKESSKKRSRRSRSSRFTMFGSDCTDLILLTF